MSTPQSAVKLRRIVWTGAIASITAVGAIYGAGLKTLGEKKQQSNNVREATLEERISYLEDQRGILVGKRIGIEKKIQEAEMRRSGATMEESTRGMERRRGQGSGGIALKERQQTTVLREDNLRVVGTEAEVGEEEKGRERRRGWW